MSTYRDLTLPEEGSTSAREILSRGLETLVEDFRRLPLGLAAAGRPRASFAAVKRALAQVLREDPGAAFTVLRRPTVGVLIRALRGQRPGSPEVSRWVDDLTATLALEFAALGVLPTSIETPAPAHVPCLSRGMVLVTPEGVETLRFSPGEVAWASSAGPRVVDLTGDDASLWQAYVPVGEECHLALFDNNPLALDEAHPDKDGNALDLGGRSVESWVAALREAFGLIEEHLPTLYGELALYIQQLVPVGVDDHAHLSASYQEAIGTIYLSLHPRVMTMAEAVIHEFSHNKLNALFEVDPVLENAFSPLFASPVRPDPRPLHGVLLAVHAFVPVARLYERMIEAGHALAERPDFLERFEAIKEKNREGAATILDNGCFTAVGEGVAEEIRRCIEHFG
ncbi:MAG: hypothetical protein JRH11_18135 [Deltaproteobacteria bacterium]|nr:hypothetical protein [Deltaproteobacteria bacterium]